MKDKDPELAIAYKILDYLRANRLKDILTELLSFTMNKYDKKLYNWWNLNAINILPYCSDNLYIDHKPTDKDWAIIVTQAANTWKEIANEWGIIITPSFMNQNSEEYKAFQDFSKKQIKLQCLAHSLKLSFGAQPLRKCTS